MSFVTSASPKEIQFLVEFGQKNTDACIRQLDEVLTHLISTKEPDFIWCRLQKSIWNWTKGIENTWHAITSRIDFTVVVFMITIAYIIWSIKLSLTRGFSLMNIFLCFLLPSIFWEFSRLMEEEKLKQYSEELRLGNIPEHCIGMDNRGWWEVILSRRAEVECYEHHLVKSGNPALRISILKVAVVHMQQLLSLVTTSIKDLTASSSDDGFFTSIIMRTVAWLCVTLFGVGVVLILSQLSMVRMASSLSTVRPQEGSRVELLEPATERTVRAPPRRRGGKRVRGEEQVDGRGGNTIIYKIMGHNVHLVSGGGQPTEAVLRHQGGGGSGDAAPFEMKALSSPSSEEGSSDEEGGRVGEKGGGLQSKASEGTKTNGSVSLLTDYPLESIDYSFILLSLCEMLLSCFSVSLYLQTTAEMKLIVVITLISAPKDWPNPGTHSIH
ncbi:uncharacterized protein [Hetaerina americana]|uniref:uncharacterized protein n=1 Tax=Hetaerina americana TaxID=62018 RepID=UPI003A7F2D07